MQPRKPTKSELEWDVSASTSRTIKLLLTIQFAVVWGLILFTGASLILGVAPRYTTGATMFELVGILILVMGVPILVFWGVLRALTGSGKRQLIAQYFFSDPARPDRTVFDHAPPRRYVVAAVIGFVGYLGAIFVLELQVEHVLGVAFASAALCYLLWWTAPNRGRLDIESGMLRVHNRRTLTEGGGGDSWDLLRGFTGDDRITSLEDGIGARTARIGDVVVLVLGHDTGYAPTVLVVPPNSESNHSGVQRLIHE